MSKQIDERVVEMRFDNQHFEKNVSNTLSTIEKLKQKLNFSGASKGFETINASAKKVDISGVGAGVEAVHAKFSALQVMGVTALANITNSAINAGKNIASALTIEPVKSGFNEYELKMGSIRTIMASTGKDLETVNKHLNELNEYSDKTIYSFSDMTQNIGKFTNAGVKLEDAVLAIKGISNEAAISGANANEASRAMYNFAQALSAGYVKLIDWKSIELANMATVEFKEQLIATAVEMGTLTKTSDGMYRTLAGNTLSATKNFNETLTDQWMTSEVLIGTLKDYADETTEIGKKATKAATQIESFTKLMDTLKETAQSGWARTWELIFGDYYQGMNLWTKLGEVIGGILDKMSDARNKLLETVMNMGLDKLQKNISTALGPIKKVGDTVDKITDSLEDLDGLVDEVILGKFGNGKERFDKLSKAGQNYYTVQNKVNEKLGDSHRYTKEQIEAQDKLLGSQKKTVEQTAKTEEATGKLTDAQKNQLIKMAKMTKEQARANGYTDEQIKALQDLKKTADKLGLPFEELINNLDEINGRWIILNAFANIGESLKKVFTAVGDALKNVFNGSHAENIFDIIVGFHKLTEEMVISDATADKLRRTFQGVFAIVDIVSRILGGGLKIAFGIVKAVVEAFGGSVLDLTAGIGDLVYGFDQWLKKHDPIVKFIEWFAEKIPPIVDNVKEFVKELYVDSGAAENFKKIADGMQSIWNVLHAKVSLSLNSVLKIIGSVFKLFGTNLGEVLAKLAEWVSLVVDWIAENTMLINGIQKIADILVLFITGIANCVKAFMELEPVQKTVEAVAKAFERLGDALHFEFDGTGLETLYNWISNIFTSIEEWINTLKNSETFLAGLNIVEGLANGIASGVGKAIDAITNIGQNIIDAFCKLLGIQSPSVLFMMFGKHIIDGLRIGLKGGIGTIVKSIVGLAKTIIDAFKAVMGIHSPSTVFMALGAFMMIGLLGGIIAFVPSIREAFKELALSVIEIMTDVFQNGIPEIWGFAKSILTKLKTSFEAFDFDIGTITVIGTLVASLLLLKQALKIGEKLVSPIEKLGNLFGTFAGFIDKLGDSIVKNIKAKTLETRANAIFTIAKAIALMAGSVALLSKMDQKALWSSVGAITALAAVLALMTVAAGAVKNLEHFGKLSVMMISMSSSLFIMAGVMKLLSTIDAESAKVAMYQMVGLILGMVTLVAAYGALVKGDASENINKVGKMLIKMSVAIGILALVMKLIAGMSWGDIGRGAAVIAGAMVLCAGFIALSKFSGEHATRAGKMLIKMSVAIGILVLVIKLISGITDGEIQKGMSVITNIMILFMSIIMLSAIAGANAAKAGGMLMLMSGAILILTMTIKMIADIPGSDVTKGMSVIGGILTLFMLVMVVSELVGNNATKAGGMFLMMSGAIMILALSIKLIAGIPLGDVVKGGLVITGILAIFTAMIAWSQLAGKNASAAGGMFVKMAAAILILVGAIALLSLLKLGDVVKGAAVVSAFLALFTGILYVSQFAASVKTELIMISVVVALLAGTLIALSCLDTDDVLKAAASITAVMTTLALVLVASKFAGGAMSSLIIITLAIGMIGGVLLLLSKMPVESTLASAAALSMVMMALSASMAIVAAAGPAATAGIPALAAMVGALALVALIFVALDKFDVKPSIATATALSIMLLAMAGVCGILAIIGPVAPAAIAGALALDGVLLIIGALVVGLGALVEKFPSIRTFLDTGVDLLVALGYGLGRVIGAFGEGIFDGFASGIESVGTSLSKFLENIQPFLDGVKDIKPESMEGVKTLAETILILSGAGLMEAVSFWLGGGSSLIRFAQQLVPFGQALNEYAKTVQGINSEAISISAKAAKGLAEVANAIPAGGGLWDLIAGDKNLALFGARLVPFGTALKQYGKEVEGINTEAISVSVKAAKGLVEVADAIPASGGLWDLLAGDQNLALFGARLVPFGKSMGEYAKAVEGVNVESIVASVKAAKGLVDVANAIPASGGLWDLLAGDNDLSTFGSRLTPFGKGMQSYSTAVANINTEAITSSVNSAKKLVNFINGLASLDTTGVGVFTSSLKTLAEAGVDKFVSTFNNCASTLKSAGATLTTNVAAGAKNKQATLTSAAKTVVSQFSKAVSSKAPDLKKPGEKLISSLAKGIKNGKADIRAAIENVCDAALKKIGKYEDDFKSAGKDLVQGFADGISENTYLATAKARAMAKAAEKAAKDELDINSPSRVFRAIGKGVPEGFAQGIGMLGSAVKRSAVSMANVAVDSVGKSISRIAGFVETDIDVNPTIRPVLDLSDVEAGANSIGGMFGRQTLAVDTNSIGVIPSAMSRIQNGSDNSDIVSAIRGLRKDLSNATGNVTNINGITYDDGSNVANAVKTLVRAARIEGRV